MYQILDIKENHVSIEKEKEIEKEIAGLQKAEELHGMFLYKLPSNRSHLSTKGNQVSCYSSMYRKKMTLSPEVNITTLSL